MSPFTLKNTLIAPLFPHSLENVCYKGLDRLFHLKKLYLTRNRIQVLENLDKNKNLEVRNIYITNLGSQRCPGYLKVLQPFTRTLTILPGN